MSKKEYDPISLAHVVAAYCIGSGFSPERQADTVRGATLALVTLMDAAGIDEEQRTAASHTMILEVTAHWQRLAVMLYPPRGAA